MAQVSHPPRRPLGSLSNDRVYDSPTRIALKGKVEREKGRLGRRSAEINRHIPVASYDLPKGNVESKRRSFLDAGDDAASSYQEGSQSSAQQARSSLTSSDGMTLNTALEQTTQADAGAVDTDQYVAAQAAPTESAVSSRGLLAARQRRSGIAARVPTPRIKSSVPRLAAPSPLMRSSAATQFENRQLFSQTLSRQASPHVTRHGWDQRSNYSQRLSEPSPLELSAVGSPNILMSRVQTLVSKSTAVRNMIRRELDTAREVPVFDINAASAGSPSTVDHTNAASPAFKSSSIPGRPASGILSPHIYMTPLPAKTPNAGWARSLSTRSPPACASVSPSNSGSKSSSAASTAMLEPIDRSDFTDNEPVYELVDASCRAHTAHPNDTMTGPSKAQRRMLAAEALESAMATAVQRLQHLDWKLAQLPVSADPSDAHVRRLLDDIDAQTTHIDGLEAQIRALHTAKPGSHAKNHRSAEIEVVSKDKSHDPTVCASTTSILDSSSNTDQTKMARLQAEITTLRQRVARESEQKEQLIDRVVHMQLRERASTAHVLSRPRRGNVLRRVVDRVAGRRRP